MGNQRRTRYLPALDGVRACALLAIMVFHTGVVLTKRFYVGAFFMVDVFFVLSGYLITTVLLNEVRELGTVRIKTFYARRALRLLPALFVALVVGAAIVWWLTPGHGLGAYSANALLTLTYMQNWVAAAGHDFGIFPHLWSLAIEEQYYLLWPALLLLGLKRGLSYRRLALFALVGAAASVILRAIVYLVYGGEVAYLWTITRVDGVLIGSALGLFLYSAPRWMAILRQARFVFIGLFVVVSISLITEPFGRSTHLGLLLVANLGSLLIVAHIATDGRSIVKRVLETAPLRGLGRISYGVYLLHPPILAGLVPLVGYWDEWFFGLVAAAVSIALATVSFVLIERPALSLKGRLQPSAERGVSRPSVRTFHWGRVGAVGAALALVIPVVVIAYQQFGTEAGLGRELVAMSSDRSPERKAEGERRLAEIVDERGWPLRSKVGQHGADAALNVALGSQDPDFLANVVTEMQQTKGAVAPREVASVTDRQLVASGQPQKYGTQLECRDGRVQPATDVADIAGVDAARAAVGLPPLAESTVGDICTTPLPSLTP